MKWECNRCGRCCRFWNISIDKSDIENIKSCGYKEKDFVKIKNSKSYLKHKFFKCVFLTNKNKCELQLKYGYKFKPKNCRQFPFVNNRNQLVCGKIIEIDPIKRAKINKSKYFLVKGKKVPLKTFFYSIEKLNYKNYIQRWNKILMGISKTKEKSINNSVIDNLINSPHESNLPSLLLKSILASHSIHYLYGIIMLYLKKSLTIKLPCGKFKIEYNKINDIKLYPKHINKFLNILKNGHGILYKSEYPQHLLFCFYFLEDFAKSIAYKNKRKKVKVLDIVNAYSKLNSVLRFPDY